ncbi:MAG: 4-phosphoerythronate dehydrogenase, partial [Planctomycetota bacterium]
KIVADTNIPSVDECFSSIGEVEVVPGRLMSPSVVADADCLLVRSITRVDSDLLAGSSVRFVGTATIGFDHIDVEYLERNNIGFASAPGSNANSAAEYVIAALLEIGRNHNITLEGKSIGIVGVGNVGGRVAKKCIALGMKVKLNDPPLRRQTGDAKYLPLEELFDCDFITLHTPLTFEGIDKTFHLADGKFLKSLKHSCIFINTARGGVADTSALKEAVNSDKIKATVLDVWENEPNIDTELLDIVDIGTPHIAGYSLDGKVAGMMMIYKAACKYFGLEVKFNVDSFLPEPSVKQLKICVNDESEQDLLRDAVGEIYSISEDDSKMRKILNVAADKRGEFFDSLRRDYPVRREFQNTKIILEPPCKSIVEKLSGIGFKG